MEISADERNRAIVQSEIRMRILDSGYYPGVFCTNQGRHDRLKNVPGKIEVMLSSTEKVNSF